MCGIVGVYNHKESSTLAYLCLYALQHRGQEGGGIVSFDGKKTHLIKEHGLISDIFSKKEKLASLKGSIAIGHNRYSTHGENLYNNIQPLQFKFQGADISIAHNGNLVNLKKIRERLEKKGTIFQTTSDTEYFIHLFSHAHGKTIEKKFLSAFQQLEGSFSVIIMYNDKLIIARDKYGIRPLCCGRINDSLIFASETCALDLIGAQYEREIKPGEMLVIDKSGEHSYKIASANPKHCIFEYVYFSRPDSKIFGDSVDKIRRKLGKNLAIEKPTKGADRVISVPDSSNTTAIGYSQRSDARFEIGLIRNHYIGRSFIEPQQQLRDFSVKIKFNTIEGVLTNRKIVIVDDSIVRGTTLKKLIRIIKKTNPKEVHVRIGSPPVKYPCFYGMDFPSKEELIANSKSVEEIRKYIDADSLEFLTIGGLLDSVSLPRDCFCTACFSGKYIEPIEKEDK